LRLSRLGTLILADNAIRGGSVLDPEDESVWATREFNEMLAKDPHLSALILPLIRERINGLAVARVLA
jgi:caffeoyl-CoA O-methyltransferase